MPRQESQKPRLGQRTWHRQSTVDAAGYDNSLSGQEAPPAPSLPDGADATADQHDPVASREGLGPDSSKFASMALRYLVSLPHEALIQQPYVVSRTSFLFRDSIS